jgi:hypothetical protein
VYVTKKNFHHCLYKLRHSYELANEQPATLIGVGRTIGAVDINMS